MPLAYGGFCYAILLHDCADGLVFKKGDVRGKCFIEYIPAEKAWSPIEADWYMYIDCLWVSGQFKGQGYSNLLLGECIRDSIPLEKSMRDGNRKNIVILTQHNGYQKQPESMTARFGGQLYNQFPRAIEAGKRWHIMYNRQLALVAEQERLGNALVICPKAPAEVERAEKDTKKLTALYEQGYADADKKL